MITAHLATARIEDAPAVAAFQTLAWQQTYRGVVDDALLDVPVSDRVDRWVERIRSASRTVTIARADGVIVGVASTSIDDPPRAGLPRRELNTLYLRQDAQGVGLGSRLLRAAIGDDAAHLLVFEVNERAQRFYERHGFAPVGGTHLDPGTGLAERRWVRPSRSAPPHHHE
ncbi:ribosomal protein S18 acetylase RimI-like enzyme [Microbacterium sp. 1154]|uniref:GNAT family N-acetyltransferase n=1 Tax=Microbacterium sp. 1154 TaxID=2817733 RepID=UPI000E37DA8D|nr:GNAT family N-acetyltransferase [Microbacterium sp. 1154]MDR6689881.1 ribosomal protein S18 acetylase RimI-like enzyme [Microbacterium sp. 1154]